MTQLDSVASNIFNPSAVLMKEEEQLRHISCFQQSHCFYIMYSPAAGLGAAAAYTPRIYNVLQLIATHLLWTFDSNRHQLVQVFRCKALTKATAQTVHSGKRTLHSWKE